MANGDEGVALDGIQATAKTERISMLLSRCCNMALSLQVMPIQQTLSDNRIVPARAFKIMSLESAYSPIDVRAKRNLIAGYLAISQICPPGSLKLAVRMPQGRSIGPFNSSTPRLASSAHIASTSATSMVSWRRTPAA